MYDFNSKKYIFLLLLVCFIFAILVIKAFDYLPKEQQVVLNASEKSRTEKTIPAENSTRVTNNENQAENSDTNVIQKQNQKSGVLYKRKNSLHDENFVLNSENSSLEEIDAPPGTIEENLNYSNDNRNATYDNKLSNDELALRAVIKARKYYSEGKNSEALEEYQKVAELTSDNELLAESYDGLSELYAKNKRFSTALSFAGKAYKASPSHAREFFIAKIYYMAGQTDTAITRLNNMLKRGLN